MGAANIIPGVSGGTIAVLMGIYDRLIEAINSLFSRDFKSLKILLPAGFGLLAGVFGFARLLEISLIRYPVPTHFFFVGLVIVSFVKAKEFFSLSLKNLIFSFSVFCVSFCFLFQVVLKAAGKDFSFFLWQALWLQRRW